MFLYLMSQEKVRGYDTFDSCVVAAKSVKDARRMHPDGNENKGITDTWCAPHNVYVQKLGVANDDIREGVLLASFNAG
jgi:hypothetical protein